MKQAVKRFIIGGEKTTAIVECRRCGKTLNPDYEICPGCESTDITRFEIR